MADPDIIEEKQRIDNNMLGGLNFIPAGVKNWFVSNIFSRVLAYLIAKNSDGSWQPLEVTSSGSLRVANTGSGISQMKKVTGTATATISGAGIQLPLISNQLRLISKDYALYVFTSTDNAQYNEGILVQANADIKLDLVAGWYKVQRADANDAIYRIEAYR